MAEIITLHKTPLVSFLERLLDKAKKEEIRGVAVVTTYSDGGVGTGWSEEIDENIFGAIGGAACLQNQLLDEGLE